MSNRESVVDQILFCKYGAVASRSACLLVLGAINYINSHIIAYNMSRIVSVCLSTDLTKAVK